MTPIQVSTVSTLTHVQNAGATVSEPEVSLECEEIMPDSPQQTNRFLQFLYKNVNITSGFGFVNLKGGHGTAPWETMNQNDNFNYALY